MVTILFLGPLVSFRIRSGASLQLELTALRYQVVVAGANAPRRLRLLTDRLFRVWL